MENTTDSTPARRPRTKRSITFLTPVEVLALLKMARKRSVRDWAALLLTYSHGLRVGETCNLTLDDIDLKGGQITVARLKGSMQTTQQLMPHRGEPLLDELKAVREYLSLRKDDGGDALFVSQKGGHLTTTQLFRIYRDIAIETGLPKSKQHPHCLKHSVATHLIAQNMNLARVKQYLGHAAISSTMKYISVSDQDASRDAMNALCNAF